MHGLVPGIHDFKAKDKNVDGRDKPGHDQCLLSLRLQVFFFSQRQPMTKYSLLAFCHS
jgi:hypothetical protein